MLKLGFAKRLLFWYNAITILQIRTKRNFSFFYINEILPLYN
jgi:hypothetical protein